MRTLPDHVYSFFDYLLDTSMELHEMGENKRNDFISLCVKIKADEKHNEESKYKSLHYYFTSYIVTIAVTKNKINRIHTIDFN